MATAEIRTDARSGNPLKSDTEEYLSLEKED